MKITGPLRASHRGYTVEFERENDHWCGKILGIEDLIMVQADRIGTMQLEAEAAIDDYLDSCKEFGVEPNQPEETDLD